MKQENDVIYSENYFNYLQNRSGLRKFIRSFYLKDIKGYSFGKTIDLGCGIGELLNILPSGSIGLEVNEVVVDFCKSKGYLVNLYNPMCDNYAFEMIDSGVYETLTMNHVLEHLENPTIVMNLIFESCNRIGIRTIIFTVPGIKGFKHDSTHRTFIDMEYLEKNNLISNKFYKLETHKYYPINSRLFSKFFTHNELRLVYKKI